MSSASRVRPSSASEQSTASERSSAATISGATRRCGANGHASGTARDSEDTLNFSVLSGVRPMIETLPLERAGEAYAKMMDNQARFRMVITTGAS